MIKSFIHIALCLFPFMLLGQLPVKEKWKKEKDFLEYKKAEKYKGPSDWYGSEPATIKEEESYQYNSNQGSGNAPIQYNPQQIKRDRENRYRGFDRGGGNGTLKHDPKVERPDPWEVDPPAPDVDLPDLKAPSIGESFWKVLLFILIFAAVIIILYQYLKNKKPATQKIIVDVEDEWNPEIISKSELELRLEQAMDQEDYRECVRIYFTFILKELISAGLIKWEKDKTNFDYSLEMRGKKGAHRFDECVRLYDIIWYGEYEIDREIYGVVRPVFDDYYKTLQSKHG